MDSDGNGVLDKGELKAALEKLGVNLGWNPYTKDYFPSSMKFQRPLHTWCTSAITPVYARHHRDV